MKYSGIGGQAVLEGIMMRNGDKYATAVRNPQGEIVVDIKETKRWAEKHKWMGWPFIRGTFNLIESLKIGIGTLMYSASIFEEEEDASKKARTEKKAEEDLVLQLEDEAKIKTKTTESKSEKQLKKEKRQEAAMLTGTLIFSLAFAIGLFSLLPTLIASLLGIDSENHALLLALVEGVIRIAIFVGYVWAVSFMKDIKRTYMYHGSEHKCINCIEAGLPLTVENVRVSSKEHKRCGTSFMLIVMIISIFVFMFIRIDSVPLRMLSRVALLPVVAGLSYEFLRLAGTCDNKFINALSRPGMWLQALTTKEPTDDMIEVAIVAVESVYDWKEFQAHMHDDEDEGKCCTK